MNTQTLQYNFYSYTNKIMNQFQDVGAQIMRPRRSQQDIFLQRLRKRLIPMFKMSKKHADNYDYHVSVDTIKKSKTGRIKTQVLDGQSQLLRNQEARDQTLNSSTIASKRAAFFDSSQQLRISQQTKFRKILLPKITKKKLDFVNLTQKWKDEQQVSTKKPNSFEKQQLITFYPFKNKKN